MTEKTRLALTLLVTALALGLLGDLLLRPTPPGLNVGLWVLFLAAGLAAIARWGRVPLNGNGRWLLLPAAGFAFGFAWRDSPGLATANLLAVFVCLALAASHSRAGRIGVASLGEYGMSGLTFLLNASVGCHQLWTRDVNWGEVPRGRWTRPTAAVGRGLALAFPLSLLFGGLFASADAAFSGLVANLFRWDVAEAARNLFWTGFWAWLAGGIASATLLGGLDPRALTSRPARASLGMVEVAMILGSLDALFLAFVLVQFRYLFGGAALVEASVGLGSAEYARRGFFELVTVAALALPVLLAGDGLLRRDSPAQDRRFRLLAGALVAMLFIVMASALLRMRFYQEEFGLTEQRLYTTAFMGWLALVFAWFLATVLRGRRERFAFGALVAGLVLVAALDALNPDALIASTNVERARSGKRFDAAYAASLSADAVPEIAAALPNLPEKERRLIAQRLLQRWSRDPAGDLRTWNWGRATARQVVAGGEEALRTMAGVGAGFTPAWGRAL